MTTSAMDMAVRLIRQCEGCRLAPYQDSAGIWTIGIGSIRMPDGSHVTDSTPPITQDDADAMMMAELRPTADRVDGMVTVPITDGMRAALYSFAYNEGTGALHGSTILRLLNTGDTDGAIAHFADWNMAGGRVVQGLANRRRLEASVAKGQVVP